MAFTSQKAGQMDQVSKNKEPYGQGTILRLNGHTLAVYKKHVPDKEYHLVLILGPSGSVKAQGVALEGYQIEELGLIAPKWFELLQTHMAWERDLIVFHCYSYEDVVKIPRSDGAREEPRAEVRPAPRASVAPAAPQPAPAAPAPEPPRAEPEPVAPAQSAAPSAQGGRPTELNGGLRRGQRLQIRFGNNFWDAVYWGHDDQGQVIAHKTYENWALMHLDLKRFFNSMQVDPEADLNLVQEIEANLLKT